MLRVLNSTGGRSLPPFLSTSGPVDFITGFHEEEGESLDRFRWMGREGVLAFEARDAESYLELWIHSGYFDLSQTLSVRIGTESHSLALTQGWGLYSLPVPAGAGEATLRVDKLFPRSLHPDDPRTLGMPIRGPRSHGDPERHRQVVLQQGNAILNTREMLEARTELRSTPTSLGIDLHGVCNIKPPCVYCEWDVSKDAEGDNVEVPFTRETLEEYGEFFDHARSLVNCSIGEPFMMKQLDELLDIFGDRGKSLEMATNGQILTDRNIAKLLGREITLYVSLDAATGQTYARLRNDNFERILANLRRLITAKGAHSGLPRVQLVFMPMKANVHELEAFVRLCAELKVDRMVLRPLNYSEASHPEWERGGYRFVYAAELLPFDQLIRVSGRAAQLCRLHGVVLSDQLDFGQALEEQFAEGFQEGEREVAASAVEEATAAAALMAAPDPWIAAGEAMLQAAAPAAAEPVLEGAPQAPEEGPMADGGGITLGRERLPICQEPWKSLYILRRGTFPCCYGGDPVAAMDRWQEAWNSPLLQEIRRELAVGRFHDYCLRSPACPLIRKSDESKSLPLQEFGPLPPRRLRDLIDRAGFGVPRKLYRGLKALARKLSASG